MKKYLGLFVAAGTVLLTLAMTALARRYGDLLDTFYPYVTRQGQSMLCRTSSAFSFPLWQILAIFLALALLGTLALVLKKRQSFFSWLSWTLAVFSVLWLVHTGIYGLNVYASPLSQDLRLENRTLTQEDFDDARLHFKAQADQAATQLPRDGQGNVIFDPFDILAAKAANGFRNLTEDGFSVFSGSTLPPKRLLWPGLFDALGLDGISVALTGEACVNPNLPPQQLPLVICRQLARRMCIIRNRDANFAAFLTCQANDDPQFQYAAWSMAYRTLTNPNEQGLATLLVRWHLQETARENEPQNKFDPTDKDYISGILGEKHD